MVRDKLSFLSPLSDPGGMAVDGTYRAVTEIDAAVTETVAKLKARAPPALAPYIKAGLTLDEFATLDPVRERIQRVLPDDVDLTLDCAQFFQRLWLPRVAVSIEQPIDALLPESPSELTSPEWHEARETAIRSAYVVPLARVLSYTFLCLNVVS